MRNSNAAMGVPNTDIRIHSVVIYFPLNHLMRSCGACIMPVTYCMRQEPNIDYYHLDPDQCVARKLRQYNRATLIFSRY